MLSGGLGDWMGVGREGELPHVMGLSIMHAVSYQDDRLHYITLKRAFESSKLRSTHTITIDDNLLLHNLKMFVLCMSDKARRLMGQGILPLTNNCVQYILTGNEQ